jgi:hypothetical protein
MTSAIAAGAIITTIPNIVIFVTLLMLFTFNPHDNKKQTQLTFGFRWANAPSRTERKTDIRKDKNFWFAA